MRESNATQALRGLYPGQSPDEDQCLSPGQVVCQSRIAYATPQAWKSDGKVKGRFALIALPFFDLCNDFNPSWPLAFPQRIAHGLGNAKAILEALQKIEGGRWYLPT